MVHHYMVHHYMVPSVPSVTSARKACDQAQPVREDQRRDGDRVPARAEALGEVRVVLVRPELRRAHQHLRQKVSY